MIALEDVATVKPIGAIDLGQQKLRALGWAGPGHLWMVTSMTTRPQISGYVFSRGEYSQAQVYDLAARKFFPLPGYKDSPGLVSSIPEYRLIDGKPNLFVEGSILASGTRQALFRVDVETGKARPIDVGPLPELPIDTDWVIDARGRELARTDYNVKTGEWKLLVHRDGRWQVIETAIYPIGPPQLFSQGTVPGAVLVSRREEDEVVYRNVSLVDGKWGEPLEVQGEVDSFLIDDVTHLAIGLTEGSGEQKRTRFFAPVDQVAWERVIRAFKGEKVNLENWTPDRKMVLLRVQGGKTGDGYMMVDQPRGTAEPLGPAYAGITVADISQPSWVSYKAADGLDIQAVLTLPRGREAKGLPLIVLPHGGPQAHDEPGFDWWAQALASRGYAVLQPNFRGSDGYGLGFVIAGHGQWGRKMQSDVSDGVRHLVKQGVADPKRVCVVGASYGGYVALAGVTLEQDVYRCAVSVNGVADLRQMLIAQRARAWGQDGPSLRYWRRFMGVERGGEEALDVLSPSKLAAKATVPVMLVHGKDDTVVPYDQSQRMAKALEAAGRKPEFLTLPAEDHWLSRSETRLQMLTATVEFLERHNPPK